MSDARGIPKRSKTVVFIVLLVFFQVLALAVLGLMALRESESGRREQNRQRITNRGRYELESVRDAAMEETERQVREATEIRDWSSLELVRGRHERPIVRQVFHVDRVRTVHWVDGEYVLYQPLAQVKIDAKAERERADDALRMRKAADEPSLGPGDRFEAWLAFVQAFPLYVGDPASPYPYAVTDARQMLRMWLVAAARSEGDQQPKPATVREAVLTSLEIEARNRVRLGEALDPFDDRILDEIDPAVDAVLRQVPDALLGVTLPGEVSGFRAYRDWVRDERNREALEGVLAAGIGELGQRAGTFLQLHGNTELFAITGDGSDRFTVLRLDLAAVGALIQAQVDPVKFRELGLEVRVIGPGETFEGDGDERIHRVDIASQGLSLPSFEAAVFRVREVSLDEGRQSELVFWAIIAFAVLGFGFGTWVLTRLVTREVRLAQLKADFVGNLSHELKTPLTSIGLFTEMLQDGKIRTPEDREEAYEVLALEAARLRRIVQRMIDVARKEAQGVAYELVPGDLNQVVREAVARFQRIVTEPGLDLVLEISPEPLPMMLDLSAMDDVITNLLSNAWKYKQGESACIRVATRRRGRKAEVVVSDDGIGIPRSEQRRVFEMFYRADQYLTQPVSGTGLGLALVRTVVRGHKGKISIGLGEGGRGTSFCVRFPISRKAAAVLTPPRGTQDNDDPRGPEDAKGASQHAEAAGRTGATS